MCRLDGPRSRIIRTPIVGRRMVWDRFTNLFIFHLFIYFIIHLFCCSFILLLICSFIQLWRLLTYLFTYFLFFTTHAWQNEDQWIMSSGATPTRFLICFKTLILFSISSMTLPPLLGDPTGG